MPHHGQRIREKYMFEYANLDYDTTGEADPIVINTWYEALPETEDVKAWYLYVEQTNNGALAEDIEVELTINGGAPVVATQAAVSGTRYTLTDDIVGAFNFSLGAITLRGADADQTVPLETRSLRIRVRQTSVVDLVAAQIEVNMTYTAKEET